MMDHSSEQEAGLLVVDIERFQGPLDLLLHLIRTQDVEIFDIPIAKITDQFLHAIKGLQVSDLDGAGEFLEMHVTSLIHIKRRCFCRARRDEDEDDPRAELVRRLLEYEQIRDVSQRHRRQKLIAVASSGRGMSPSPQEEP